MRFDSGRIFRSGAAHDVLFCVAASPRADRFCDVGGYAVCAM